MVMEHHYEWKQLTLPINWKTLMWKSLTISTFIFHRLKGIAASAIRLYPNDVCTSASSFNRPKAKSSYRSVTLIF